ncbi:unnamed protein product [Schistosoma mattheei]|uniref:Uncharacterized protein n=1 Tax=Schistosoma mattheei TaxID=31246 RepID=A0A183P2K2_9TREM|nr:unnamed protein product [Schistosoma mattheei]
MTWIKKHLIDNNAILLPYNHYHSFLCSVTNTQTPAYYGDIALDEHESQMMLSKGMALSDDPLQIWDLEDNKETNNRRNKYSNIPNSKPLDDIKIEMSKYAYLNYSSENSLTVGTVANEFIEQNVTALQ